MATPHDPQLQAVIGRALVDRAFRDRLANDVRATLSEEGFSLDEATIRSIEEVVQEPGRVQPITQRFDSEFLARADYVA